jgi:hypothetical protein
MAGDRVMASARLQNRPRARGRTTVPSYSASVQATVPLPEKTLKWFIQNQVICSRSCDGE